MRLKNLLNAAAGAAIALSGMAVATTAEAGEVFDRIKERGKIRCGVQAGMTGFSFTSTEGAWEGHTTGICGAIAAAVFGDKNAVEYVPSSVAERLTQIQVGEIDIAGSLTAQYSRDVSLGLRFLRTTFFTGQGFIMPKALGITDPEKLDGVTACIQSGTSSELQTPQFFNSRKLAFEAVSFDNTPALLQAYQDGRCDTISLDQSTLASLRLGFKSPDDHVVADQTYTEVHSGPFTSDRDAQWINIATWSINALIVAENLGITKANVDEMRAKSEDGDVRRLLGVSGDLGPMMGLTNDWAYNVIKQVGNYGELYDQYLGPETRINLPRGLNKLVKDGGAIYAPPIR